LVCLAPADEVLSRGRGEFAFEMYPYEAESVDRIYLNGNIQKAAPYKSRAAV
jgi:hypothetical protein